MKGNYDLNDEQRQKRDQMANQIQLCNARKAQDQQTDLLTSESEGS